MLLLGLPASRQIPLQHLLERAGYAVLCAPDPAMVPVWIPVQQTSAPLLVLADAKVAGAVLAHVLDMFRAGADQMVLVRLASGCDMAEVDVAQLDLETDRIQLPAQPGHVLQVLARARNRCAGHGEDRPC